MASLGEFEQCRPVIEALKKKQIQIEIILTFFFHLQDMKFKKIMFRLIGLAIYLKIITVWLSNLFEKLIRIR